MAGRPYLVKTKFKNIVIIFNKILTFNLLCANTIDVTVIFYSCECLFMYFDTLSMFVYYIPPYLQETT
jgi:hypothetical protein